MWNICSKFKGFVILYGIKFLEFTLVSIGEGAFCPL